MINAKTINLKVFNPYPLSSEPYEIEGYLPAFHDKNQYTFIFTYNSNEIIIEDYDGRAHACYYVKNLNQYKDFVEYLSRTTISPMILIKDNRVKFYLFDENWIPSNTPLSFSKDKGIYISNFSDVKPYCFLTEIINRHYEFHYSGEFIKVDYFVGGLIKFRHIAGYTIEVTPDEENWNRIITLIHHDKFQSKAGFDHFHYMDNVEDWMKNKVPFHKWSLEERRYMNGKYNTRFTIEVEDVEQCEFDVLIGWKDGEYRGEYFPVYEKRLGINYEGCPFLLVSEQGVEYEFDTEDEEKYEHLKKNESIVVSYPSIIERIDDPEDD